jgi:hypothetical protein
MTTALNIALISGLAAIGSVLLSSYAAIKATRMQHELELRRSKFDRSTAVEEVMSRFRDPLTRASIDLQGRIYSIVATDYIPRHVNSDDPELARYARNSTLFRLAEYFGWLEVLRRGVQFLDFGNQEKGRELNILLHRIGFAFANRHRFPNSTFRLFRDEQRAIGELVLEAIPGDSRGYRCMGYARFVERFEGDSSFSRWFDRLVADIGTMADPSPGCMDRLAVVNNLLIDLLEFLDPGGVRYPIFDHPDILDTAAADYRPNTDGRLPIAAPTANANPPVPQPGLRSMPGSTDP